MKKLLSALAAGILALLTGFLGQPNTVEVLGTAESGSQWINITQFSGFQTKLDPTKIDDGANANGQNTSANEGDRISVRNLGYELFPSSATLSESTPGVGTLHTFRKRDGASILMNAVTSTLSYYETANDTWETLKTGYTSDDFGFADNNVNTDLTSYTYFGNAKEPFSRWNGAKTLLNGALAGGETTVTVDSTSDFDSVGSIVFCGTEYAYTSKTATSFALSGTAGACADNRGVAQAVREFSSSSFPRGNIYLFSDNRLFVSGVTSSPQIVYFSAYGSSTNFGSLSTLVTDSTDASAGLFNLGEGGGPVVAMVMDEGSNYFFKRSIIYKATLSDSTYLLEPLKTFDQKSQTTGAINKRSTFVSGNGVFFITPDNQIMYLQRVQQIDYPQIVPVSDIIKPTIDGLIFTSSTGVVFQDKAFFSAKSSSDEVAQDVVLVYNLREQFWESPIVGWSVGDLAIYADGTLEELYFGDARTANVYRVITQPNDGDYEVTASWRSKQYNFGLQHALKNIENVYVEGYISPNTDLTISLLLDEDGFTQRYSTTLSGDETEYIYDATEYNVFGLSPFGTKRFGSNEDTTGKKKFRIYLGKDFRQVPFHVAQIEFASDGANQQWEVLGYGFLVRPNPVPEKRSLFKAFR